MHLNKTLIKNRIKRFPVMKLDMFYRPNMTATYI